MATSAKGGPKRVKRSTRKKTAAAAKPVVQEEVVVRASEAAGPPSRGLFQRGTVRHREVTNFLRQLIMLLESGTSILKSLQILSNRGQSLALRALVADIMEYVEAGNPLWQAFDRHPRYFDTVFVNLIKASEASGTLVVVLRRVTEYREARELLRKRVRGAMIYPVVLVVACFGVLLLLANFVVPEFQAIFEKANIEIPASTRFIIDGSDVAAVWWWVPVVLVVALVIVYKVWFVQSPLRRLAGDKVKIKIPIVGPIMHKNALVEMTRTMALLLRSGLSMLATLELTRNAIHNRAVAQSLQGLRDSVEQGGGLEAPLRASSDVIPPVVADMFVTGEESGRVDAVAEQIAEVYEEEVKIAVSGLGEALQPVFTVIVGLAVLVLFVSLFLPMIGMLESISNSAG